MTTLTTQRLARVCQCMAVMTFVLLIGMLLSNAACWLFPNLNSVEGGYGVSFGLTNRLIAGLGVDLSVFPWWQLLGGIVLSSIPLLVLAAGLYQLYLLFQVYGYG